jgi:ATP-dependent helicase/nuclease subunit A
VARDKRVPLVWQLARLRDRRKEAAEDRRLLYVAATRAEERLLVSGHVKVKASGEISAGGWLAPLCDAAGVTSVPRGFQPDGSDPGVLVCVPQVNWPPAAAVCGTVYGALYVAPPPAPQQNRGEEHAPANLAARLLAPLPPSAAADGDRRPNRIWRVAPPAEVSWAPAWVVGKLVHAAIATWRWPGDGDFDAWCRASARTHGLGDGPRLADALRRTRRVLQQFQRHPLYAEVAGAEARFHELPFTPPAEFEEDPRGRVGSAIALPAGAPHGQIDLLFRSGEQWTLVDFKTNRIRDERGRAEAEEAYRPQVERYAAAVTHFLGAAPRCLLCLLDDRGTTSVVTLRDTPAPAGGPTH